MAEEALALGVEVLRGVSTTSGWGITPSADGVLIPDLSLIVMPFIRKVGANCCRDLEFAGRDPPARNLKSRGRWELFFLFCRGLYLGLAAGR